MTDEELEALLEALEASLLDEVRAALASVADEYANALDDATELVAARFSVSGIRGMWRRRVGGIMDRLRTIAGRAAEVAADDAGAELPDDWDENLADYTEATRVLLDAVGERLADAATQALADGLNAGDSLDELKDRLTAVFADGGTQLGEGRAQRIAMTEATRAFNAGTLAAAQAMSGPDRPLVKQWLTRNDARVRDAHRDVNGQLQLLDDPFEVDGTPMLYPGDPTAPADLTVNCRCIMRTAVAEGNQSVDAGAQGGVTAAAADSEGFQSRMPAQLKRYWLTGEGAGKIRWGTPGSFDRCVRNLRDDFPQDTEGLCANLYHEATGKWPGQNSLEAESQEQDGRQILTWSTPDAAALAFEDQQTGDGRVFTPGSLYWSGGPWPLNYADEMNGGHSGARLAGAIFEMGRDGHRIDASGVIYPNQAAGTEAAMLLSQGAPLGVSVDLDDVDIEVVDASETTPAGTYRAHLMTASLLPLPDGGWHLTGESAPTWTASGTGTVAESSRVDIVTGPDGRVPADAFQITAAAGDSGGGGVVVERQESGQYLMRITKARVRGATLVAIPAFVDARIVLDTHYGETQADDITAGAAANEYDRVVRHVRKSLLPVTAADAARFLRLPITSVRRHLARATQKGELVRIARGTYVKPVEAAVAVAATAVAEMTASATGSVDLPVADRNAEWDGDAAATRVFAWADGDVSKLDRAFAYRDDDADPSTKASRKLGYADVVDGTLTIIPRGVFAAQGALDGARGGVDLPADQREAVRERLDAVRAHVDEATGGDEREEMEASAWTAMRDLPAMPAAWFAAPTDAELPPGGPGVNYKGGRIFGWVAQAGEPHAGYASKVTIDGLGRIDTNHFLRQRFTLDDGSTVKAGAFTMNVGHHRDGAECETSACQFDDSRTVAGIVTVGMTSRGMWFSGAAAPWMSEWDRSVFMATQPSYHLRKGSSGAWQLRAVLAVPVPGHSSPLMAAAVTERAQLALTAAAMMAEVDDAVAAAVAGATPAVAPVATPAMVADVAPEAEGFDYDRLADSLVAAMSRAEQKRVDDAAELEALLSEGRKLNGTGTDVEGN